MENLVCGIISSLVSSLSVANRSMPVKLKSFEKYKAVEYKIKIEDKIINEKLKEISNQNKQFKDKKENDWQ